MGGTHRAHPQGRDEGHPGLRAQPCGTRVPLGRLSRGMQGPGRGRRYFAQLLSREQLLLHGRTSPSGQYPERGGACQGQPLRGEPRQGYRQRCVLCMAGQERLVRDGETELWSQYLCQDASDTALLGREGRGRIPLRHGRDGARGVLGMGDTSGEGAIPRHHLHSRGVQPSVVPRLHLPRTLRLPL